MALKKPSARTTKPKTSGLRVRTFSSVAETREQAKKGGQSGLIWSVPKDGCVVRFITEPDEWVSYWEYYDADSKTFVPMVEGEDVPGDPPSQRFLANVLWQSDGSQQGKVVPFKMPKSVVNSLLNKHEKYDTMTDRDYEISKYGEGKNTEYDVTPEEKKKVVLSKYEALDLLDVLVAERDRALGVASAAADEEEEEETEEEEDEKPRRGAASSKSKASAVRKGRKAAAEEEEEEEEEEEPEEEEEDEEETIDPKALKALGRKGDKDDEDAQATLSDLAEQVELDPDDFPTWLELADAIIEAASEEEEEEEEEAEEEEEEEEEDEDDEGVEIDAESLAEMSIAELRELCDEYEIEHDGLKTKKALIAAIIEAAEE